MLPKHARCQYATSRSATLTQVARGRVDPHDADSPALHQGEFIAVVPRPDPFGQYRLGESNPRHRAENPTSLSTRPRRHVITYTSPTRERSAFPPGRYQPFRSHSSPSVIALEGEDSNLRHPGPEPGVLPLNYPQMYEQHLILSQASAADCTHP